MDESDLGRHKDAVAVSLEHSAEAESRRLRVVLAQVAAGVVGMQLSMPAGALTIGEPSHLSRLFEPLRVDIPIEADVVDSDLRVRLIMGSHDAVATTGESPGLRQELTTDARGQRVLRVTTQAVIHEPMMTLHVDLADSKLQLRRDITLLFDPPSVDVPSAPVIARQSDATAEAVDRRPAPDAVAEVPQAIQTSPTALPPQASKSAPVVAVITTMPPRGRALRAQPRQAPAGSAARTRPPVQKSAAAPGETPDAAARAAAATATAQPVKTPGWRYTRPVRRGEALEQIAQRIRPSSDTSIAAMTKLLRWENPRAFTPRGGKLMNGVRLRFPDRASLAARLAAFESAPVLAVKPVVAAAQAATASAAVAAGAQIQPFAAAAVSLVPIATPSAPALRLAEGLTTSSMQALSTLAGSPTAETSAAPQPATVGKDDAAAAAAAATGAAILGAAVRPGAVTPSAAAPTASVAAAAATPLPVPTIFPAWLIAGALAFGGGMAWALSRILVNTPVPVPPRPRRAFGRSPAAPAALVDEWLTRGDEFEITPSRAKAGANVASDVARTPGSAGLATGSRPTSVWDPETFDLTRSDDDGDSARFTGDGGSRSQGGGRGPDQTRR